METLFKIFLLAGLLFGCVPVQKKSGALLDDSSNFEITDPDDVIPTSCEPLSPQVFTASPSNKKTISDIDAISTAEILSGDPVTENVTALGQDNSWGSAYEKTSNSPPGFTNYLHFNTNGGDSRHIYIAVDQNNLAKEDIIFISFYIKAISNNHIYNGTYLTVKYKSSSSAVDELDRMILTVPETIPNTWQRVYYPVQINSSDPDTPSVNIQISSAKFFEQEFFIGGFSVKNYKQTVAFLDFPNFEEYYNGIEDNAQWRIDALARIENIRMKDVSISFKDSNGKSLNNICVTVKQLRHKFSFAGAIETYDPGNVWYEQHFTLFNETTMRNAQKWKANQKNEGDDQKESFVDKVDVFLDPAIARGNVIRSHAILWSKLDNTPSWVKDYLHVVTPPPVIQMDVNIVVIALVKLTSQKHSKIELKMS